MCPFPACVVHGHYMMRAVIGVSLPDWYDVACNAQKMANIISNIFKFLLIN